MNAGATMTRVYRDIKARVMQGSFAPGERIDPARLAQDLYTSATPVRDALHRLSGERLIESGHHEGFRAPLLGEADLCDLYGWAAALLTQALAVPVLPGAPLALADRGEEADYAAALSRLFRSIASQSTNRELRLAIANLLERSQVFRVAEARVDPRCVAAIAAMARDWHAGRRRALHTKILRFHSRRALFAGRVLAEMRPPDPLLEP